MCGRQVVIAITNIRQSPTLSRFPDIWATNFPRNLEVNPQGRWFGGKMNRKYAVIFEQAETNWAAYVPDLPGCVSTGKTLEETERNVREAISGHIEALRAFGESTPKPTTVAR